MQPIYEGDHYSLIYFKKEHYLYVDWIGFQPWQAVHEGCEKMLKAVIELKITKILNDNRNVKGLWDHQWVANNWFPRMVAAGVSQFAWVLSPEGLSAELVAATIRTTEARWIIKPFNDIVPAKQWLAVQ